MKRLLAIFLSLVMTFSLAAIPVSASIEDDIQDAETVYGDVSDSFGGVIDSAEDIYNSFEEEDYGAAVSGAVTFIENLFNAIHLLVHSLSEMFDFNCPFCDGDYDFDETEESEEETTTEEPTTEEPTTEEPTTEEPTTEEPTTEEPTTEEPTTEEPTTEEPTTEEPTTEEPTTEEPTTEEPTTEEPTTEEPTTAPTLSEYSVEVKNSTIGNDKNYNYTSKDLYAMYAEIGIKFRNTYYTANVVTVDTMATAYVKTAILIDATSAGVNQIIFKGENHFHNYGDSFKLLVNNSSKSVAIKLNDSTYVGNTLITAENIGDYITGAYTLV